MTFIAFSGASFGCRNDHSSQGGFILFMVHKDVANGAEGHVIDWRWWKASGGCGAIWPHKLYQLHGRERLTKQELKSKASKKRVDKLHFSWMQVSKRTSGWVIS
jgi:hypothetical protein